MRRVAPLLALVALATAAPLSPTGRGAVAYAGYTETAKGLKDLLASVAPRKGVHHRWLAVVPLVSPGIPKIDGPISLEAGSSWKPAPRADAPYRVAIERVARVGVPPAPFLLPSGTVLRRGAEERLTLHPTLLPDGEAVLVDTIPLQPIVDATPPTSDTPGVIGLLSPVDFRHTVFERPKSGVLRDLLGVDALLLGLSPQKVSVPLARLDGSDSPKGEGGPAADRRAPADNAMTDLTVAYGGDVVGHVVFLGNRAVEFVLTSRPAFYRSFIASEHRALAVSLVAWEEAYGQGGLVEKDPDWDGMLKESSRLLAAFGDVSLRPIKRDEPRPAAGEIWRMKATVRGGRTAVEPGWILADASGSPVFLEAWPEGGSGLLPPPAPAPGRKPPEEEEKDKKGGGISQFYLKRLLDRLKKMFPDDTPRIDALERFLDSLGLGDK